MYKKSVYNILIAESFLWNTLTGAVIRLSPDGLAFYQKGCEQENSSYFQLLQSNGFFVDEALDEVQKVLNRERHLQRIPYPEDLFFVIAPTLRCNYDCNYCFEHRRDIKSDMSVEVRDQLLEYLEKRISSNPNLNRLHVTWFGGEPLLRLDLVDFLSKRITDICQRQKVVYRPTLITNGRFLDDNAMALMVRDDFRKIQISVDGTCQTYCAQKGASEQDYAIVIENIVHAAEKSSNILVRINVAEREIHEAYQLTEYLLNNRGLDGKIKVYLAFVNQEGAQDKLSAFCDFVEQGRKFQEMFGTRYAQRSYMFKRPLAKGVSCRLTCDSNFCIGPMGELYKCEHHFGRKEWIVGSIRDGVLAERQEMFDNFQLSTTDLQKCSQCDIFPICMGGCINHRIMKERIYDCEKLREQLIARIVAPLKG